MCVAEERFLFDTRMGVLPPSVRPSLPPFLRPSVPLSLRPQCCAEQPGVAGAPRCTQHAGASAAVTAHRHRGHRGGECGPRPRPLLWPVFLIASDHVLLYRRRHVPVTHTCVPASGCAAGGEGRERGAGVSAGGSSDSGVSAGVHTRHGHGEDASRAAGVCVCIATLAAQALALDLPDD
jgi:hypothetical protein